MPVICAPFEPEMPFGFSLKSIDGHERISLSSTIAKCWNWSCPPKLTRLPRCASSRVMSPNLSVPSFVNCISTIGWPELVSKSWRVPESLRSTPFISGIGFSEFSGWYLKR